jgi:AraC-like DNA-binding protein
MSRPKQLSIEYRNYLLPASFPLILLSGEKWHISDVPSQTLHFHNCLEIGYCLSDSGTIRFRNEEAAFQKDDIAIVGSNIPHTTYSTPGTSSLWNYIFVNVEDLFSPYFPVEVIGHHEVLTRLVRDFHGVLSSREHPEISWLVQEIIATLQQQDRNYQFSVRGLMLSLMVRLMNLFALQEQQDARSLERNSLPIAPALHYIRTNYAQDFQMDTLAAVCDLSPTHFRRLFSSIMGFGPLEYLNRIRITHAVTMLRITERPILDISEEVGFHSISSFNRHFSEIVGMTPSNYRKQLSAANDRSIQKCNGWMTPPEEE